MPDAEFPPHIVANFDTLVAALHAGQLGLLPFKDRHTGAIVHLLCALNVTSAGIVDAAGNPVNQSFVPVPLAAMLEGNAVLTRLLPPDMHNPGRFLGEPDPAADLPLNIVPGAP